MEKARIEKRKALETDAVKLAKIEPHLRLVYCRFCLRQVIIQTAASSASPHQNNYTVAGPT